MLALQSEIPSLCISHDTRTRELAKRLLVPTIDIQTFIESRYDIRRLFFACKFDGRAFETNRSEIAEGYSQLFREVGVKPSSHLLSFL